MPAALCHQYDVMLSGDVIRHVTIRLSIDDFLYVLLNRNQTRISIHCDAVVNFITNNIKLVLTHRPMMDGLRQLYSTARRGLCGLSSCKKLPAFECIRPMYKKLTVRRFFHTVAQLTGMGNWDKGVHKNPLGVQICFYINLVPAKS